MEQACRGRREINKDGERFDVCWRNLDTQQRWHDFTQSPPLLGCGSVGMSIQTLTDDGTWRGIRIKAPLTLPSTVAKKGWQTGGWGECICVRAVGVHLVLKSQFKQFLHFSFTYQLWAFCMFLVSLVFSILTLFIPLFLFDYSISIYPTIHQSLLKLIANWPVLWNFFHSDKTAQKHQCRNIKKKVLGNYVSLCHQSSVTALRVKQSNKYRRERVNSSKAADSCKVWYWFPMAVSVRA